MPLHQARCSYCGGKSNSAVLVGPIAPEKYSGTEVKYEGVEYLIVSAKDIIATVE